MASGNRNKGRHKVSKGLLITLSGDDLFKRE